VHSVQGINQCAWIWESPNTYLPLVEARGKRETDEPGVDYEIRRELFPRGAYYPSHYSCYGDVRG